MEDTSKKFKDKISAYYSLITMQGLDKILKKEFLDGEDYSSVTMEALDNLIKKAFE